MPALVCVSLLVAVAAQGGEPSVGAASDEIIVTGERVRRSLRETPSSVSVFTEDDIDRQKGSERLEDLLSQVPNVQLGSGGQGPAIRGQDSTGPLRDLPAFLGGNRPRVTLQVDGRAVGYNEFVFGVAPLWDVEQVEVFRSPQTTTQGRNSIAGAVFVQTQDPEFSWSAKARGLVGNLKTRQISGALTGPLASDQVAFRVAGDLRLARPASKIGDLAVGANPNHDNYGQLRAKVLVRPHALPGSSLLATFAHSESQMPQIEGVVAPFRQRKDPDARYGTFGTNIDSLTLEMAAPLTRQLRVAATLSGGDSRIQRFAPDLLGQTKIHSRDYSAEVLADWQAADALRLHAGLHLLRTKLDQRINLFAFQGLGVFDDLQTSSGVFGEVELSPLARLKLTGGLRYQSDRQDRAGVRAIDGAPLIDFDRSFSAWLPKLTASYRFSDNLTAGLLVQRAYNPGGTTLNFETGGPELFDAETLWDFEIFARSVLGGGSVRLDANLFINSIRDAQRTKAHVLTVPPRTLVWAEIENAPKAWATGVEMTASWKATRTLSVRAAIGFLQTKITDAGTFPEIESKSFQRSPRFSGSAGFDWEPMDRLRLSASVRHHGRYYSDDENSPALAIGAGTIFDARASYERGPVTVFGYARNLFDAFEMRTLTTRTSGTADDPREVGVGIEARF